MTGLQNTMALKMGMLLLRFGATVYLGLDKGIKILSRVNIYVVLLFFGVILICGPTIYILASMTSRKLNGYEQPERWNRMVWAVIFMVFAAAIMVVGGFETIQAVCVLAGFPLIFVCTILMKSIYKMVREDA